MDYAIKAEGSSRPWLYHILVKTFGEDATRANLQAVRQRPFGGEAEVGERYAQKQLGHALAETARKYQRRHDKV